MKLCKLILATLLCMFALNSASAQVLLDEMRPKTPPTSSLIQDALRIDLSNTANMPQYNHQNNIAKKRSDVMWYPVEGEVYYLNENEPAGHIYHDIDANGYPINQIIVATKNSSLYDSTYSVMNATPYSKGKNLIDTVYNYDKNADGIYEPVFKTVYSYHYFDHFDGDSLFNETLYYDWNPSTNQWQNWGRQKFGYHDTVVESCTRTSQHSGMGNTWNLDFYSYDSVSYNEYGWVDSVYQNRYVSGSTYSYRSKVGFTYDIPSDCYTQKKYLAKQNNEWVEHSLDYNIEWTECNGFTFTSVLFLLNPTPTTPYKVSKIKSYNWRDPSGDFYYEKWWDVGDTKNNFDTLYQIVDGERIMNRSFAYYYNEYSDLIEWRGGSYNLNTGEKLENIHLYPHIYHPMYGLVETKIYFYSTAMADTTFLESIKYTKFVSSTGISEQEAAKQQLQLAPNPAANSVWVSAKEELESIALLDLSGRQLRIEEKLNTTNAALSLEGIPAGVYIVRGKTKQGFYQVGKLVKN